MTPSSFHKITALSDVRVILALLGVVLHTCGRMQELVPHSGFDIWQWLYQAIHIFRMQTFFVISGYLSVHAMMRPGYLTKRARQLLIPGAATALLLFPFVMRTKIWQHSLGEFNLFSVWFLVALYLLTLLGWALRRSGVLQRLLGLVQNHLYITIGLVILYAVGINHLHGYLNHYYDWSRRFTLGGTALVTLDYIPYYLGGLMLALSPKWQRSLADPIWRMSGFLAWVFYLLATLVYPPIVSSVVFSTSVTLVVTIALASLALETKLDLDWTKSFVDKCLTIYLWHMPLISVFNAIRKILKLDLPPVILFVYLAGGSLIGSLIAYAVIERDSLLRWMWLGEAFPKITFTRKSGGMRRLRWN